MYGKYANINKQYMYALFQNSDTQRDPESILHILMLYPSRTIAVVTCHFRDFYIILRAILSTHCGQPTVRLL